MEKKAFSLATIQTVLHKAGVSQQAINLYLVLRDLANEEGKIEFKAVDFEEMFGLKKRSFSAYVTELSEHMLIHKIGMSKMVVLPIPEIDLDRREMLLKSKSAIICGVLGMYLMFGSAAKCETFCCETWIVGRTNR